MNPKRSSPQPIIDNLEFIGNPFKQNTFSSKPFIGNTIRGADTDLEYALKFLYSYQGSSATFNSYRREVERLLQWSWRIEESSILKLQREDIESFIRFYLKPPVAWIGTQNVARFKNNQGERVINEKWRPFVSTISKMEFDKGNHADVKQFSPSQSAIKAAFSILSSFYEFLIQEGLIEFNPVKLIKQKSKFIRKDQIKAVVRRISNLQWEYVLETAELMAEENPIEHERTLFIMNCLFAMYLRISELVADERSTPLLSDFRKDNDGNWWFHVIGKGNKNRIVTVSNDMLKALKRYRKSIGLSPLPSPDENIPLVQKVKGSGSMTSTRHIRRIVQHCFDQSFERMKKDGLAEDAQELKAATVHWLRHTGISEDVKIRPREHVRDDAGHASMATTDRYIDSDLRERHASGKKKRLREL